MLSSILLMCGCSQPIPDRNISSAIETKTLKLIPEPGNAIVYFLNDAKPEYASINLYADGKHFSDVWSGHFAFIELPQGQHKLQILVQERICHYGSMVGSYEDAQIGTRYRELTFNLLPSSKYFLLLPDRTYPNGKRNTCSVNWSSLKLQWLSIAEGEKLFSERHLTYYNRDSYYLVSGKKWQDMDKPIECLDFFPDREIGLEDVDRFRLPNDYRPDYFVKFKCIRESD